MRTIRLKSVGDPDFDSELTFRVGYRISDTNVRGDKGRYHSLRVSSKAEGDSQPDDCDECGVRTDPRPESDSRYSS